MTLLSVNIISNIYFRDIRRAVIQEDRSTLQKIIFPLPRAVQSSLNSKYRAVHKINLSACTVLAKDFIWHMITAENLPKYQIDYFVKLVGEIQL